MWENKLGSVNSHCVESTLGYIYLLNGRMPQEGLYVEIAGTLARAQRGHNYFKEPHSSSYSQSWAPWGWPQSKQGSAPGQQSPTRPLHPCKCVRAPKVRNKTELPDIHRPLPEGSKANSSQVRNKLCTLKHLLPHSSYFNKDYHFTHRCPPNVTVFALRLDGKSSQLVSP